MTTLQEKVREGLETDQNSLYVASTQGYTPHPYDPTDPDEVAKTREVFDSLVGEEKYVGYTVQADGSQGEVIRDFDPTARAIVMMTQTAGG